MRASNLEKHAISLALLLIPFTQPAYASDAGYVVSDQLKYVVNLLIEHCPIDSSVPKLHANGSLAAHEALCSLEDQLDQTTAPIIGRLDPNFVCSPENCPTAGSGTGDLINFHLGWSASVVIRDQFDYQGCQDLGANWATTLRTIYGGVDGSGSRAACDSDIRRELLANFAEIYGGGSCENTRCQQLEHAFWPGTNADATQIFKSLTGTQNFCNVPDPNDKTDAFRNDNADNDPIRRCCSLFPSAGNGPRDRYCPGNSDFDPIQMPDGSTCERSIGVVLPIAVPTVEEFGGDNYYGHQLANAANNNTNCKAGKFGFALPAGRPGQVCPTGASKIAGLCRYPLDSNGHFGCNNFRNNRPAGVRLDWDGREYNRVPRLPDGTQVYPSENFRQEFWRMTVECDYAEGRHLQLGCVAGRHPCSIGFGHRELALAEIADPPKTTGVDPINAEAVSLTIQGAHPINPEAVRSGAYPLREEVNLVSITGTSTQPQQTFEQELLSCLNHPETVSSVLSIAKIVSLDPEEAIRSTWTTCE